MSDASKLKVLYKAALPREGCQISRFLQKTLGAEAKPKPGKPLCVKPATDPEKLRGNPLQTSVETLGNPRQTVEACVEFWKPAGNTRKPAGTPAGNLQEPTGNQQETCRKPARSPQVTHGKLGKLAVVWKLAQKPKRNPRNTLGRKRAKETCTKLRQTCSKAVETRRKHACGKLGNPASREQLGYLRCRNLPAVNYKKLARNLSKGHACAKPIKNGNLQETSGNPRGARRKLLETWTFAWNATRKSAGSLEKLENPAGNHRVRGKEGPAHKNLARKRQRRSRADLNRDRWIQSPEC